MKLHKDKSIFKDAVTITAQQITLSFLLRHSIIFNRFQCSFLNVRKERKETCTAK